MIDVKELISMLQALSIQYGMKTIWALLIIVIGRIIAKVMSSFIRKILIKGNVDKTLILFISNLSYFALLVFFILAALGQVGVQTASFVAVIGAAGLAIGLAFQGTLSNFAAGVLLITFRPFKSGDFIQAAGVTGVVEAIHIFTTDVVSVDNKKMIIPNAKLTGDNIINYTAKEKRRVDLVIGVSYQDDIQKVKTTLEKVIAEDARVLKDPKTQIVVGELGDSSVNFYVRPWVKTEQYWDVYFALTENIKKRFDAEDICIPFPQRDVHLFQEKATQ